MSLNSAEKNLLGNTSDKKGSRIEIPLMFHPPNELQLEVQNNIDHTDTTSHSGNPEVVYSQVGNKQNKSKRWAFQAKFRVFLFLEHPKSGWSNAYHTLVFALTIVILIGTILSTVNSLTTPTFIWTYVSLEIIIVSIFIVEYILRVWSCSVLDIYVGWRFIFFMCRPFMLMDLIVIISSVPMIFLYLINYDFNSNIFLFLKALQIFRFFHFEGYHGSVRLMAAVLYVHRNELLTGYCASLILILFTSFMIFVAEKNSISNEMKNIPESIYFSVISYLTIGYGDVVPTTAAAKILIVILAFLGVALAAVPSGIIGSGFALQAASRAKQRKKKQVRKPATILIQRACRCYLYFNSEDSCVYKQDYLKVTSNPKNKSFPVAREPNRSIDEPQRPIISATTNAATINNLAPSTVNTQTNVVTGSNSKIVRTLEEFTEKFPLDSQLTVTSQDRFNYVHKKRRIVLGKGWSPKQTKNHPSTYATHQTMSYLIRICGRFIRFLQFRAACRKFRISKSPGSVEDMLEELGTCQKKIAYQLEDIRESVKDLHQRTSSTSSAPSRPSLDLSVSDSVHSRFQEIETRVLNIEAATNKILKILMP